VLNLFTARGEPMTDPIRVEVVFAAPDDQLLVSIMVDKGATVADAILKSGIHDRFPAELFDTMQAGIWGRPVDHSCQLKDGDRVEIYRPLRRDPRDARRELAQSGLTMSESSEDEPR